MHGVPNELHALLFLILFINDELHALLLVEEPDIAKSAHAVTSFDHGHTALLNSKGYKSISTSRK